MQEKRRSLKELLQSLPAYDAAKVEAAYQEALQADGTKVIALDDDPTGVQTVHDVFVYTDWKPETMQAAFADGNKISFILTNSRGMTAGESRRAHEEITSAVAQAAQSAGRPFAVLCRGDSTLRGHYPLETDVVRRTLEACGEPPVDGEIIMPFFLEGGRYTAGDVHYVAAGDELIPAAETEFARDKTFGYHSSNLREWIEEKTGGAYPAQQVSSVSLGELRALDYEGIEDKLLAMRDFSRMIVNAVCEEDVKVFVTALLRALGKGKCFVYRSAAALVARPAYAPGAGGRQGGRYGHRRGGLACEQDHGSAPGAQKMRGTALYRDQPAHGGGRGGLPARDGPRGGRGRGLSGFGQELRGVHPARAL